MSIVGCGDYEALMKHRAVANGCAVDSAEYQRRVPANLLSLLAAHDPVHRAAHFADAKILFVAAGNDTLVPHACNQRVLERLRAVGTVTVEEAIVPDVPHSLAPAMIPVAAQWFQKHAAALTEAAPVPAQL